MEYTKPGSSDLGISRICLGCMGFGDPAAGKEHERLSNAGHLEEEGR